MGSPLGQLYEVRQPTHEPSDACLFAPPIDGKKKGPVRGPALYKFWERMPERPDPYVEIGALLQMRKDWAKLQGMHLGRERRGLSSQPA
jgi:hypothetical protein